MRIVIVLLENMAVGNRTDTERMCQTADAFEALKFCTELMSRITGSQCRLSLKLNRMNAVLP